MCPSLWCHSVVSSHIEAKEIEELTLPVHKYNVPTFSPFSITNYLLVTFHILAINVDMQPSLSNYPIEIRFFLKYGTCLTSFNNHWFPLCCFIFTFPVPTILHGASVRQHRYSNRGRTPSVTTHITRSKINTPMFSRGKTPKGKHPRPQPTRTLGAVY